MIKGILFDKDGTLLEFYSTMHHIYTEVFARLQDRYQAPEELMQAVKTALGYRPARLRSDSLLRFYTNPQIADAVMAVSRQYGDRRQWHLPYTRSHLLTLIDDRSLAETVPYAPLPGVPETLQYLHNRGYRLGIATADTRAATVLGLKKTGLLSFFDYLGTGDLPRPKPDPFMAEEFCGLFGISNGDLLIVGDSRNDMHFAENSGADFLGINPPGNAPSPFENTEHTSIDHLNPMIALFNL